jgi:hypothetical protein
VEAVWALDGNAPDTERKLAELDHIWSRHYLDIRLAYQTQKPLQILALRVHRLQTPRVLPWQAEYFGCKSWVELSQELALQPSEPVFEDGRFSAMRLHAEQILGAG